MNKFDQIFFQKYIPEGVTIKSIIHQHIIVIIGKIILNYFFGVIIPSFLYYYSDKIKELIPFFVLEIFLFLMFLKIIYEVFDWYNDVWIITEDGVVELDWKLFSVNTVSVQYKSIEGIELIQDGVIDTILGKGDLVIHKIGGENFILKNASSAYVAIDEIDKYSKEVKEKEKENSGQNFETVLKVLSGVVEEYLGKSGYKKDDSEEKDELIKKVKKIQGTIDLSK